MAHKVAPDAQEAIATAKFIRMSPTKARQVIDLIRGRHIEDARRVLKFNARGAALPVGKVLDSAIANAEHNRGLPADELIVVRAWADEGPTLKRFRPRAMGRATRVRKRTCHISVVVGRPEHLDVAPPTVDERPKAKKRRGTTESSSGRAGGKGPVSKSAGKTGEEAQSETAATVKQTKKRVAKDSGLADKTPKAGTAASPASEAAPAKTSKTSTEGEAK